MSSPINVIGHDNFKKEVLEAKEPVLVDFWAPWCVPCQMMAPILESLANDFSGKLKIAKVDTEVAENYNLAENYQIMSIPNMKLFKNGQVIKDFIGFRPKEMFAGELKAFL
ncbi:thioredoxin [Patescibacteria group bacterium]|nr:thioredoxin [Patescibacteria group bacterium]